MEKLKKDFEADLRQKILIRLQDLHTKIETNEKYPEKEQDINSLIEIDDTLDNILNSWYY